jgi:membrane-associated protein
MRASWWDSVGNAAGNVVDWLANLGGRIEDGILSLAASVWIYPGIFAATVIDGIFPPVPSESVVIAAAAVAQQEGRPYLWGIFAVAAAGAWCGDQIAYSIGRVIPLTRIPFLRGARGRAAVEWADHALEHRGTSFILAARFIPIGRVAVNLSAGALRFPRPRFMAIDAVAALLWATYGCVLGAFAGDLVHDNLLLSITVGVVGGIVLGVVVDRLLARLGLQPAHVPSIEERVAEESSEPAPRTRKGGSRG